MKQNLTEYKDEFIYYLKILNCFDKFVNNLRFYKNVSLDQYLTKQFYRNKPITDLINNAFHWDSTDEGLCFWSEQEFELFSLVQNKSYKNRNIDNSFWSD